MKPLQGLDAHDRWAGVHHILNPFCLHSPLDTEIPENYTDEVSDPGIVTRSPSGINSRINPGTCLRSHRRHSSNFMGSTLCVKGAHVTSHAMLVNALSKLSVCVPPILILLPLPHPFLYLLFCSHFLASFFLATRFFLFSCGSLSGELCCTAVWHRIL